MAALSNARYEIFAQAVANGDEIGHAYTKAGYKPNKGNPTTLKKKKEVQSRIEELLEGRAAQTLAQTVSEVHYTREKLLSYLEVAKDIAIKKDDSKALTSAAIGMGRILGLIIDRREVGDAGAFDNLTDEELVANAAKKARELGIEGPQLVEDDEDKVA